MKAEITTLKQEPKFEPVSITLTFETKGELDAFGSLFNSAPIMDAVRKLSNSSFAPMTNQFEQAGSDIFKNVNLINEIKARI